MHSVIHYPITVDTLITTDAKHCNILCRSQQSDWLHNVTEYVQNSFLHLLNYSLIPTRYWVDKDDIILKCFHYLLFILGVFSDFCFSVNAPLMVLQSFLFIYAFCKFTDVLIHFDVLAILKWLPRVLIALCMILQNEGMCESPDTMF